jgi:hypothetical protein
VEERAHDAAGDRHRADGVAEAGARGIGHVVVVLTLHADGDARAVPVGERVVRTLVGVGALRALPVTAHVDDVRVVRADVVDLDVELLEHARQLVGEEDVRRRRELVEDVEAFGLGEVEREALLASVGVLEQHVHVQRDVHRARRREAAHRVAALDVLDLDDLRAPV